MPLLNPKSDNLIQMLSKTNKKDPRYPKSFRRVIPNYSSHVVQGPEADLTLIKYCSYIVCFTLQIYEHKHENDLEHS